MELFGAIQLSQVQIFEKEVLIGRTEESAISLSLRIDEKNELSISGNEYEIADIISESEGKQRARDSLVDDELWKMSVKDDNTFIGMDEWNQMVIDTDGWQSVLGDISEIAFDKYVRFGSCGQIITHLKPKDFVQSEVNTKELKLIFSAWKQLHLKTLFGKGKYTKQDYKVVEQVKNIFEKLPTFDHGQICKYVEDEEI